MSANAWVITGPTAATLNGSAVANVLQIDFNVRSVAATAVVPAFTEVSLQLRVTDTGAQSRITSALAGLDAAASAAYQSEVAKHLPFQTVKAVAGDTVTFSGVTYTIAAGLDDQHVGD
jgi:hypothetical protein